MKKLYFLCVMFCFTSKLSAQLTQVFVEEIYHSPEELPELDGYTSYRLFAQTVSPLDFVVEVTGQASPCPATICSTGDWYNETSFAGNQGQQSNIALWNIFPSIQYDTYYTIGLSSSSSLGLPVAEDFNASDAGGYLGHEDIFDFSPTILTGVMEMLFTSAPSAGCIVDLSDQIGGAWYAYIGDPNGYGIGVNNSVLLGQFTTNGTYSHELNISVIPFDQPLETYTNCTSSIPGLSYVSNSGCTDNTACNYNPDALIDNGLCFSPGDSCNDQNSQTINDTAQADCSCEGDLLGCTEVLACNYNSDAVIDDASCFYENDPCDDGNSATLNDLIHADCSCEGDLLGCTEVLACNYNSDAVIDDASCFYENDPCDDGNSATLNDLVHGNCECLGFVPGCTNVIACNFDPNAGLMDDSCVFENDPCDDGISFTINETLNSSCECVGGTSDCTNPVACNYNADAEEDDGSCYFLGDSCQFGSNFGTVGYSCNCEYTVSGTAFIDNNQNGIYDSFEVPLPFQQVILEPGNVQVITNDEGEFTFLIEQAGSYTVSIDYNFPWAEYTTPLLYLFDVEEEVQNLNFGVTNLDEILSPIICADFYSSGAGIPCNDNLNYNICWRNTGPGVISGVVEVQMDELMSLNFTDPTHDSIVGQSVFWTYENLSSNIMRFDDINMYTPDETHIGEYITNTVIVHAWWEGELLPVADKILTQEITCAYDPNDITGYPLGYTDEHWVLPDTRMEYLIRFQNTGNAPAGTVRIIDTLDIDMDWSSFELMANSHSVMTTIEQETGKVEFLFDNINLPDSTENEPESHGMVSFKIDFAEGITLGEEVNQTAYIFFDNNPPVVTNTTWHTIHECGGEGVFNASATEVCIGEDISFSSVYPHVEDYQWNVNSIPAGNDADYSQLFNELGDYIVQLVSENPICSDATSQLITIHDLPTAEITEDGAILTASPASGYQWYQDGEPIYGAINQTYEATADGSFYVVVMNENNCSSQSETVMIVNVSELTETLILLYPNPMTSVSTLEISTSQKKTIEVVDTQGKVVRAWENITDQRVEFQKGELSSGTYFVNISLEDDTVKTMALIIR